MKLSQETFMVLNEAIWLYANHIEHDKLTPKKDKKKTLKEIETALEEIQGIGTY